MEAKNGAKNKKKEDICAAFGDRKKRWDHEAACDQLSACRNGNSSSFCGNSGGGL